MPYDGRGERINSATTNSLTDPILSVSRRVQRMLAMPLAFLSCISRFEGMDQKSRRRQSSLVEVIHPHHADCRKEAGELV